MFRFFLTTLTSLDVSLKLVRNSQGYQSSCQSSLRRQPMFKLPESKAKNMCTRNPRTFQYIYFPDVHQNSHGLVLMVYLGWKFFAIVCINTCVGTYPWVFFSFKCHSLCEFSLSSKCSSLSWCNYTTNLWGKYWTWSPAVLASWWLSLNWGPGANLMFSDLITMRFQQLFIMPSDYFLNC